MHYVTWIGILIVGLWLSEEITMFFTVIKSFIMTENDRMLWARVKLANPNLNIRELEEIYSMIRSESFTKFTPHR